MPECRIRRWRARQSARFSGGGGGGGEGRRLGFAGSGLGWGAPSACGCEGEGAIEGGRGMKIRVCGGAARRLYMPPGRAVPLLCSRAGPCRPACRGKGPSMACYGPRAGTGTFAFRAVPCSGRAPPPCFGPCLRPAGCMLRISYRVCQICTGIPYVAGKHIVHISISCYLMPIYQITLRFSILL